MKTKIIVRADDLGYSRAVNLGIADTVKHGIINNVGLMVNMPTTESGLAMLQGEDICLGCHTNITAGRPLTDPTRIPSLVTTDGYFRSSRDYRTTKQDFVVLAEAVTEVEAQYQRFIDLTGHKPGYFEGHAVASNNFVKALRIVARRHHLDFLDFAFEHQPVPYRGMNLYMVMESMQPGYDPVETLRKMAAVRHDDGYGMMICHPGYLDNYILIHSTLTVPRTKEVDMLCAPRTKSWLIEHQIELIKYTDITAKTPTTL